MAYLLLLALVYTFAIAILFFQSADQQRSAAQASLGFGFLLLAIGYGTQIALGFELNEGAARLFYWARAMLPLAWLGHGLLLFLFPGNKILAWSGRGLILASFIALGLVAFTQITNAEDWFQPARVIYGQIGDLLATNRPTRWLALLLNAYGFGALVGGAAYLAARKRSISGLRALLIILGAMVMATPLYWPPSQTNWGFYAVELLGPIILFLAMPSLIRADVQASKTKKHRFAS